MHGQTSRRKEDGAQLVEFGVSLYFLAAALIIPTVCSAGLFFSFLIGQVATYQAVIAAAEAPSYDMALTRAVDKLEAETKEGFGAQAHLEPDGGYLQSGANLFIDARTKKDSRTISFGPNVALSKPADVLTLSYNYRLTSNFKAGPLLPFCPVEIPYVTKPVTLCFSASCPIERSESLNLYLTVPGGAPRGSL